EGASPSFSVNPRSRLTRYQERDHGAAGRPPRLARLRAGHRLVALLQGRARDHRRVARLERRARGPRARSCGIHSVFTWSVDEPAVTDLIGREYVSLQVK